jgi:peptidoglycan/LPS O-acetylase OafA/YrhL
MINIDSRQRAAVVLGATAIICTVFVLFGGPFKFVPLYWGALAVGGFLLGAFAVVAGFSGRRMLILLAGALFLVGVLVALVLLIVGTEGFLRVNVGPLSLWTGLGTGLAALGLTPDRTPADRV